MPTIRLHKVAKIYKGKGRQMAAVLNIELEISQGEFVFLVGSRGAGKSTLMDIITGDLAPDQGAVYLNDTDINRLPRRQHARLRRVIGKVSQDPDLIRENTVYENLTGIRGKSFFRNIFLEEKLVGKALGLVGMPGSEDNFPRDYTFAQCRKLELARAILHSPPILALDGITDRMDDDTIWDIFMLLNELNARGTTIIMATTAKKFVNIMRRRVVTLADGKIVGDVKRGRYGDII